MLKARSLQQHLTEALPFIKRDPNKLTLLVKAGSINTRATTTLAFEYSYTLQVMLLDFAGHADAVIVPLLIWLRTHQPDALDAPDAQTKAVRFDVDFLTKTTVDMVIELDLTERVVVRPRDDVPGGLNVIHHAEPTHPAVVPREERWSLWLQDTKLAEWTQDPRP